VRLGQLIEEDKNMKSTKAMTKSAPAVFAVVEAIPHHEETYLALRRTVGWIGILLPFALAAGNRFIFGGDLLLHSISRYYHTPMRDVFVGGLCAMGLFLFFYSGYDSWEDWGGNVAGFFAIGVALVPTNPIGDDRVTGIVHLIFAALLFLTLANYSVFLFTRRRFHPGPRQRLRAVFHRVCGAIMVGAIVATAIHALGPECDKSTCHFTLVAETIGLVAFGSSWLLEGRDLASRCAR
jgi:hypothetical protein